MISEYCTVLYCALLYCALLHCALLCSTVLYCALLCSTMLYCALLDCALGYCTHNVVFMCLSVLEFSVLLILCACAYVSVCVCTCAYVCLYMCACVCVFVCVRARQGPARQVCGDFRGGKRACTRPHLLQPLRHTLIANYGSERSAYRSQADLETPSDLCSMQKGCSAHSSVYSVPGSAVICMMSSQSLPSHASCVTGLLRCLDIIRSLVPYIYAAML
eukprot:COSAG05_NODE_1645_length_4351_cov_17.986595_6_plen_218_part_00